MLSIYNTSTLTNYKRKNTQTSIRLLNNEMNKRNCQQNRLIGNTRKSYIRTRIPEDTTLLPTAF